MFKQLRILTASSFVLLAYSLVSDAAPLTYPTVEAGVANTKHNFSVNWGAEALAAGVADTRTVKATSETQLCVFCHTPHGATTDVTPLWNRELSGVSNYTAYASESLDATVNSPNGTSKLCLSCHDGTIAIGTVNVINATTNVTVTGLEGTMPAGTDGNTRNLGIDLTNDHPISFSYDDTLAGNDGELYAPSGTAAPALIAERETGLQPEVPLENVDIDNRNQVQCTSCHDPHVWDSTGSQNIKFLRLNRFQVINEPADDSFDKKDDIICLACHNKAGWAGSVHASPGVAEEQYQGDSDLDRDFPDGIAVWEAACLNCHDTHTNTGANRLQRGGVTGTAAATEETCYQCHDGSGAVVPTTVADIKSDFSLAIHMPITDAEQKSTEGAAHAIGTGTDGDEGTSRGKDFIEDQANLAQRHAECTDCHNPHRVMRNAQFDGGGTADQGTHLHIAGVTHTNEASGVLSGTWGVEPIYNANCGKASNWATCDPTADISYEVRRDTHNNNNLNPPVDKEYQVCLKCHSSYAYGGSPPLLENTFGGTPLNTNGMTQYTDQALEFQGSETGEPGGNHSSWHPVRMATGRDATARGGLDPNNFNSPWSDNDVAGNVGSQTMYCTDCHGSNTASATSVVPDGGEVAGGKVWGPHGSSNNFILKGAWDTAGAVPDSNVLCFKCHNKDSYSPATLPATYPQSGFSCVNCLGGAGMGAGACNMNAGSEPNLHIGHKQLVGELRCSWCHAAVPHGWKNKALLVNVGLDAGTTATPVQQPPYYQNAMLGGNAATGITFATSGNWIDTDCGGGGAGGGWMNANCNNPP